MRAGLAVINILVMVTYPVAVYWGLVHWGARGAGLVMLALLLPGLLSKLSKARRDDLLAAVRLPLAVMALVAAAAWLDDPRLMLAVPVLINLALLFGFATSLRGVPMVERFARLTDPALSSEQVHYCRSVTKVWSAFFAFNALVSAALGLWAAYAVWAVYTGLLAYILMGTLGASEYIVRKYKFRQYGDGLHDRLLARVFPPRDQDEGAL